MRKIVLGISAGSCIELSFHFIRHFPLDMMLYVVPSKNAKILCKAEKNISLLDAINSLRNRNMIIESSITSPLASGSFTFESCIILPTSSNTLSRIACGMQNNLLTRIAAVCLKERRKLILAVREMPFSTILLENMKVLSSYGVTVAPPVLGYYGGIENLENAHNFLVGRYFDLLGIENDLFVRWGADI